MKKNTREPPQFFQCYFHSNLTESIEFITLSANGNIDAANQFRRLFFTDKLIEIKPLQNQLNLFNES